MERVRKELCVMLCLVFQFQFKYILALFTHAITIQSFEQTELVDAQQFVSFSLQSVTVRTTNLL